MSVLMGLYAAEPEAADPTLHEIDASWYERQPVWLEAVAPVVGASYRLELAAEFHPRGADARVDVRWMALLTPVGQLVWAKPLEVEFDRAIFTVTYGLDVLIDAAALRALQLAG